MTENCDRNKLTLLEAAAQPKSRPGHNSGVVEAARTPARGHQLQVYVIFYRLRLSTPLFHRRQLTYEWRVPVELRQCTQKNCFS